NVIDPTAEIYDPLADTWVQAPAPPHARAKHSATLLRTGRVLVCGGNDGAAPSVNSCDVFDPWASGGAAWAAEADMGQSHAWHAALRLPDGRVIVATDSIATPTTELFTEATRGRVGLWERAGDLAFGRFDAAAAGLPD